MAQFNKKYYQDHFDEFCENGNLNAVKQCCETYKLDPNVSFEVAVAYGQFDIVKYLIENKLVTLEDKELLFVYMSDELDSHGGDVDSEKYISTINYLLDNGAKFPSNYYYHFCNNGKILNAFANHPRVIASDSLEREQCESKVRNSASFWSQSKSSNFISLLENGYQDKFLLGNRFLPKISDS